MVTYITWAAMLFSTLIRAQDTLSLTMRQADSLFMQRNLLALAGHYQIEAAQALVIQARLLDNPIINAELNAYNPAVGRPLDIGSRGQKAFSIQQTILLAGKRNKRIAVATEQARLTELQFTDLLRILRFELRSHFNETYFTQKTLREYALQLGRLTETVQSVERHNSGNNLVERESVLLKTLLLQLSTNQLDLQNQLIGQQRELRTLLQNKAFVSPVLTDGDLSRFDVPLPSLEQAARLALDNRPDWLGTEVAVQQADANLTLQKALATPDLRIGGFYDQNASYTTHYTALTLSIDLPLLNKNQGYIRSARAQADYQRQLSQNARTVVENEVLAALQQIQQTKAAYRLIAPGFSARFDRVNEEVLRSYEQNDLSVIELASHFETYLEHTQLHNRLKASYINAYEQLCFLVGTNLFK
ncbi:MAG: TolC family protein [Bacteroidetes bacterium]|nr:TolC family protein [Fibrella sp.]